MGAATWYQIIATYVAVTKLAELGSEGQRYQVGSYNIPGALSLGSTGEYVSKLQYMLSVLSQFIPEIPEPVIDGLYGIITRDSVLAYQRYAGLTPSGLVGASTWDSIYNRFEGIQQTVLDNDTLFPEGIQSGAVETISDVQRSLQTVAPVFSPMVSPRISGMLDRNTTRAIAKLQTQLGLRPTGQPTGELRRYLTMLSQGQNAATQVRHRQYPGYALYTGQSDPIERRNRG